MTRIEAIEQLTSKAIIYTVLIECEASMGGKTWQIVLSDNHARKGRGRGETLEYAATAALIDLNMACGGQLSRYVKEGTCEPS